LGGRPSGHGASVDRRRTIRRSGASSSAVQPRSDRDRGPERRALAGWRPSTSHHVRFVPGPSGGGAWPLPEGNARALLPSDPVPRPDRGWSSVGRPPAPGLLVPGRSSIRAASEAGADRPLLPSEEGNGGARPEMGLVPRRELPHSLRSACAVSHDLDGLPLSETVRRVSSGHARGVWGPAGIPSREVPAPSDPRAIRHELSPKASSAPLEVRSAEAGQRPLPAWRTRRAMRAIPRGHASQVVRPFAKRFRARPGQPRSRPTRPVFPPGGRDESRDAGPRSCGLRFTSPDSGRDRRAPRRGAGPSGLVGDHTVRARGVTEG
jgi:hypothetical protein